ncbi:MAG: AAA family ATPase, partial [Gemmatimonadales bacterium]|nr:AAA family ATPase [Gemmatimonadales bacterium]
MSAFVIAIDGPAASGKSSTAAAVAKELGAVHLDSGALYRGLTAVALTMNPRSAEAILRSAEARDLELREIGEDVVPFLDGLAAEPLIRGAEVNALVSDVSAMPLLREWVNARLRAAARSGRLFVLDGRDIGTAVFPNAPVKIFLTATPEARARRRLIQRGEG